MKLGYRLDDKSLERLLSQLSGVPGMTGGSQVVSEATLAASQMDWSRVQEDKEQWTRMARAAFSVLDTDCDGQLQRSEITDILIGRIPIQVCPAARCLVSCIGLVGKLLIS